METLLSDDSSLTLISLVFSNFHMRVPYKRGPLDHARVMLINMSELLVALYRFSRHIN